MSFHLHDKNLHVKQLLSICVLERCQNGITAILITWTFFQKRFSYLQLFVLSYYTNCKNKQKTSGVIVKDRLFNCVSRDQWRVVKTLIHHMGGIIIKSTIIFAALNNGIHLLRTHEAFKLN